MLAIQSNFLSFLKNFSKFNLWVSQQDTAQLSATLLNSSPNCPMLCYFAQLSAILLNSLPHCPILRHTAQNCHFAELTAILPITPSPPTIQTPPPHYRLTPSADLNELVIGKVDLGTENCRHHCFSRTEQSIKIIAVSHYSATQWCWHVKYDWLLFNTVHYYLLARVNEWCCVQSNGFIW